MNGVDDDSDGEAWEASDDVKGGPLPPELVKLARAKELQYLRDMEVYRYASVADCVRITGRRPIGLRWIDTNKSSKETPNIRSRLVCTEVRRPGLEPIFAATPPLDALRALLVKAASRWGRTNKELTLQLVDVSRAHFYAQAVRDVFVRLPPEDPRSHEHGLCGKLHKTMYGTLDAAERWALHYTEVLEKAGFQSGSSSPCIFWHKGRDIWLVVHGDDFVSVAEPGDQDFLHQTLSDVYEVKKSVAGSGHDTQIRILGRVMTWSPDGWQMEGDPQHLEMAASSLGLDGAKGVSSPVAEDPGILSAAAIKKIRLELSQPGRSSVKLCTSQQNLLSAEQIKVYQSVAARLNYLSLDRPDIGYAIKECMRTMTAPCDDDLKALKRIIRYLLSMPRLAYLFQWAPLVDEVVVWGDAN